ncbi:hypothetical protein GUITHDRAFT_156349 [Guillardia theta CCMP2712]|uniref:UVR domain-containing protein n=1 Tax=Guillardia theta (strain CCMP2712) TaxID=905079 RepID=L1I8Z8_GUITC|nr:hypothetical protein GUITHDRAFT_156349 [Guillardia theta CCMP2712]EKX32359.1 hypothetical protein GUITHDRAFT_156349 [Guillardia theta CCMP2712]|eukprot:XP_005819339.1 hypothetical protein GUITHDRAFT_156349 [Guillardia theta CCMP2712]
MIHIAGLDPGTAPPNLDVLYFSGVFVCLVAAGLIQFQTYAGDVGLEKFLRQGPEDKNWERKQARSAMSDKLRKNEEAKGSWLASVLPKLDFVEVYGQEKPEKEAKEGGADKKEEEEMKDKQDSMMKAVERQDFQQVQELKEELKRSEDK